MNTALQPAHPRDMSGVAAWIHQADAARAQPERRSGYVAVEASNYHVAQTQDGPIVSRLQWSPADDGHLVPIHNMFSVTASERDLALDAWSVKLEGEKNLDFGDAEVGRPRVSTGRMR